MIWIYDTREQRPWDLGPDGVRRCMPAGDYTTEELFGRAAIERKEPGDLVSTLTYGRERFTRELEILATYDRAVIIVESELEDVIEWRYRSQVSPACLVGSFASFSARYRVETIFAGSRRNAEIIARALLAKWSKHLAPKGDA